MKISLGIELGEEYCKIAVARQFGVSMKLLDCRVVSIRSQGEADIAKTIADEFRKAKYKSRSIAVSLPRNFVTVRNLHLPSKDEAEIKKMISFHITRIVPHKIEEVVYSYCLSGTDEMGYRRVTLAIAHNEIIKRQLKILDKAGFLVDGITLSSYCTWQRMMKEHHQEVNKDEVYLVLDVDDMFADFIIFDREDLLFSRSIAAKAKELDTEMGLRKLLGEVRQSLLIFQNEEINKKPQRIYLTGAVASSQAREIEKELEIPVTYVGPPAFGDKAKARVKDKGPQTEPEQDTAAGPVSLNAVSSLLLLAENEKRLSFDLPEIKIRKALREKIMALVVLGSLIIYFLGIMCFIFLSRIYNQEGYLSRLQEGYIAIEKDIGNLAQQVGKIEFVKDYLQVRKTHMYTLNQLQQIIPSSMALSNVRMTVEGKVTLRGQVFRLAEVFNFISVLEKVKYFKGVQTKYTRKGRWQNQEVTDFEITLQIETE